MKEVLKFIVLLFLGGMMLIGLLGGLFDVYNDVKSHSSEKEALEQSKEKKTVHFDLNEIQKVQAGVSGTVSVGNSQKNGDGYNYQISTDINNGTNKNIKQITISVASYNTSMDMFDVNAYSYDTKTISISIPSQSTQKVHYSTILNSGYAFRQVLLEQVIFSDGTIMNL